MGVDSKLLLVLIESVRAIEIRLDELESCLGEDAGGGSDAIGFAFDTDDDFDPDASEY